MTGGQPAASATLESWAARAASNSGRFKAAETLLHTGVPRLVAIGLYANLLDGDGRALLEDPGVLPVQFRAFALAHTAGLRRLRAAGQGGTDWVMLTPPAMLRADGPRLGRYRVGGETAPSGELSYADLATAVVDEIEKPHFHRTRVSVFN